MFGFVPTYVLPLHDCRKGDVFFFLTLEVSGLSAHYILKQWLKKER